MPNPINELTISFKALQRARTTLEDFCSSYFFYHDLRIAQHLFKYLDVLVYVEATIYQLDEDNEALAQQGRVEPHRRLLEGSALVGVLQQLDLYDDRVRAELTQGDTYWMLERHLCAQMLSSDRVPVEFTLADVIQTHEAKSFDYRLLNLVLYRLRKVPPDDTLLQFLRVDELLVDIGDDLTDYEDDVGRISELEQRHSQLLATLPEPLQRHFWQRHQEASAEQGSDRWQFPRPILDEHAYRTEMALLEAK